MTKQTHKLLFRATIFGICHLFEKRHRIANITSPSWVNKNVCLRSLHKKNSRSVRSVHQSVTLTSRLVPIGLEWKWRRGHGPMPVHRHRLLTTTMTTSCCTSWHNRYNCFCPPCTNIDTASTLIDACLFTVWQKSTSAQAFDIVSKCHICVGLIIS